MSSWSVRCALVATVLSTGCSASSNSGGGAQDAGHGSDSGNATCHMEAGLWYCPGSKVGVPSCPGITNPDAACGYDGGPCFFCSITGAPGPNNPGTGSSCTCDRSNGTALDAGDSATWDCIASNWLCQ